MHTVAVSTGEADAIVILLSKAILSLSRWRILFGWPLQSDCDGARRTTPGADLYATGGFDKCPPRNHTLQEIQMPPAAADPWVGAGAIPAVWTDIDLGEFCDS